jgi:hypothetical protein
MTKYFHFEMHGSSGFFAKHSIVCIDGSMNNQFSDFATQERLNNRVLYFSAASENGLKKTSSIRIAV